MPGIFRGRRIGMRPAAAAVWFLSILPVSAVACKCQLSLDVCAETQYSNVVFVGTVESITPEFMTRWKPLSRAPVSIVNHALDAYLADRSPARFSSLKDAVRTAFPGVGAETRKRLDGATNLRELSNLFGSVLDGTRQVHFRVRTLFRKADDDDDAKGDDDDDDAPESLDVMTPFGDCGNDFQVGETYLVYANSDEETEGLSTDACTRTRRATDAGPDLAYLSFYKDRKNPSGRVQGFATFDLAYQAHPREPERIQLPAAGVVVELASGSGVRYTSTNPFGQFVFDGLDAGSYTLRAYPDGFPEIKQVLSGPRPFHLEARTCTTQILTIAKEAP